MTTYGTGGRTSLRSPLYVVFHRVMQQYTSVLTTTNTANSMGQYRIAHINCGPPRSNHVLSIPPPLTYRQHFVDYMR